MIVRISKIALLFILIFTFACPLGLQKGFFRVLPNFQSLAQEEINLEETCQSMEEIEKKCQVLSATECRQLLEECAKYYEEKSAQIEKDITKTEQEKKTLQNQVYILRNKIQNLEYQIYQSNLIIKDLGVQVEDTQSSIEKTSLKIRNSRYQLANILQCIYEEDQRSIIEILLSEKELSDFFDDLMALETLNSKNQELLVNIKSLKSSLESEEKLLSEEKESTERMVKIQTLQKQESAKTKEEQEYFLKLTETEYQKYLKEKKETEKQAAEIRTRIFELIGVPEAPTFGEALEIAKSVEAITGVRPAFLLAVLTQESNIGKNVGQCFLQDPKTGDGIIAYNGRKVEKVMKPMGLSGRKGDVDDFLTITKELGRDSYNTPVSCPMSYGWGGAMGPAQFIPTTWMIYKDQLTEILGRTPDPWNIKDAFLAAALYLSRYGADKKTYDAEFNAALSYFAGPSWYKSRYKNIYERDYGYPVMRIVESYEADIKALEK